MQTDRLRYRARFEVIDELLEDLGHLTDVAKGEFLGVADTTVSRNRAGEVEPSRVFMGAIQSRFPTVPFEQLFERVESHPSGPAGPRPGNPNPGPTGPGREEGVA